MDTPLRSTDPKPPLTHQQLQVSKFLFVKAHVDNFVGFRLGDKHIPLDVLMIILNYLKPSDLGNVAKACRQLRAVVMSDPFLRSKTEVILSALNLSPNSVFQRLEQQVLSARQKYIRAVEKMIFKAKNDVAKTKLNEKIRQNYLESNPNNPDDYLENTTAAGGKKTLAPMSMGLMRTIPIDEDADFAATLKAFEEDEKKQEAREKKALEKKQSGCEIS
jgi:hypothetical protein